MPNAPIGSGFNVTPAAKQTVVAVANSSPKPTTPVAPVAPPAAKVETPATSETKASVAKSPEQLELDKRFNALVAKERSRAQRAMQAAQQTKAQAAKIAELEAKLQSLTPQPASREQLQNDLKARALQNPLEAMKDLGLTYEQLTQYVLNDSRPTPELVETRMQKELQAIREENARRDQEFKAAEAHRIEQQNQQALQQYEQATQQVKLEIDDFVKARPDDFALVSKNEASDTVFEVMSQHYNNTGRIMNVEEACKLVEEYFEEQALDLFKVAKLQAKLGKPATPTTQSETPGAVTPGAVGNEAAPKSKPKWVPTTLTHQIATDGSAKPVKEVLTPAQRKAKVLAKLLGPS